VKEYDAPQCPDFVTTVNFHSPSNGVSAFTLGVAATVNAAHTLAIMTVRLELLNMASLVLAS
jgi:hypothetical protein